MRKKVSFDLDIIHGDYEARSLYQCSMSRYKNSKTKLLIECSFSPSQEEVDSGFAVPIYAYVGRKKVKPLTLKFDDEVVEKVMITPSSSVEMESFSAVMDVEDEFDDEDMEVFVDDVSEDLGEFLKEFNFRM